jgi:hypothetical protein
MVPLLHNPPITKHKYHIRILYSSQPVSNNHHSPIILIPLENSLDSLLRLSVEVRRGLVKEQEARFPYQSPGNGQPLLLATGQGNALGTYLGVVALGKGDDEVVDLGVSAGLVDVFLRYGVFVYAEDDVFPYCPVEEAWFLGDEGYLLAVVA